MTYLKSGKAFLLAALAVGCSSPGGGAGASPPPGGAAATRQHAADEAGEAKEALEEYAFAKRADLVEKLNRELDSLGEQVDELSVEFEGSGDEAEADARAELQVVRASFAHTRKQLDASGAATRASWSQARNEVWQSFAELEASWTRARVRLSKKIAP